MSSTDATLELDTAIDNISVPDTSSPDVGIDTEDVAPVDLSEPDTGPSACEPGEGCFGEPCANADDCLSGICSLHMGAYVCSKTCDEVCPSGWSCKLISGGGDGQYVCVSNYSHLCLPCSTADGCTGEVPNACVKYSDGLSFCGGSCDLETPCPEGFDCQEVETTTGAKTYQCVNSQGVCECSSLAIETGLASPCSTSNDLGSCSGYRVCTETGLEACDAATPSVETCNGIDDDCDGVVDEDMCDDGNTCTIDICQGAEGCAYEPINEGECMDGDVCTVGDHCEAGICVGTPLDCDDGNPCTEDVCDNLGGCSFTNQTVLCDDGDPCTLGDLCQDGACVGTATLECDDSNPCTDDSCGQNGCDHIANTAECDDGNTCSTTSACIGGLCKATSIVICDDGDICTDDYCEPTEGCLTSWNTAPCDDDNVCTLGDNCGGGECLAGVTIFDCDDGNTCTDNSCDPIVGCQFTANTNPCDDKNECTLGDSCSQGICQGEGSLACDDNNPCTQDSCLLNGGCDHTIIEGLCSDGDPCTTGDKCAGGTCQAGASLNCDDSNNCTSETCQDGNCVFSPTDNDCDDGNACTLIDGCKQGNCTGLSMLACDDGNPCTKDSCDPQVGCTHTPTSTPCSDDDACTLGDACEEGLCIGGPKLECVDGNPCTNDGCDPQSGCSFEANNAECHDENICTTQDSCGNGLCQGGPPLECNDANPCTDDSCDPQEGCLSTNNEAGCNDNDACTSNDVCIDGKCQGNDPIACNDENPCTDDACNPAEGCTYVPNNNECDDGNVCSTGDQCSEGTCTPQGLLNCDDGNACTDDSCDPGQGGCVHIAGDCPCGNDCWGAEGCLTAAGRCIRFSCRAGNQSENFCQSCFGGEWKEISYDDWMNSGYCGDVIDKYRDVEGTNTKCGGGKHCCSSSGECSGGDNAWHFWNNGSNYYTGPCLGCNANTNCTYWNNVDNGSYTRITACEKK